MTNVGIIGGGAWGTALAQAQGLAGRNTILWAREPQVVESINTTRENTMYLPGVKLDAQIRATNDLSEAVEPEILLLVVPAQHLRKTLKDIADLEGKTLVLCAKGIEIETGDLLTDIVHNLTGLEASVLTGPTFASEIARGMPCAVTIASANLEDARRLSNVLGSKTFRPYASDDRIGAELGGAVKNVIAIASGVCAGKGYGESARAALITRGLAEMMRLALKMGGKRETLMGMCGLGDLVLTASSMQSRNFSLGHALGKGQSLEDILGSRNSVTEGVSTARAVAKLATDHHLDLPIIFGIDAMLHQGRAADLVIDDILSRPFGDE
ncbi:MAG TPA: NAD(P)H-dependent glycerol-3-phosphate dehydrogenase [Alphaproteobacteria bacterium]